MIVRLIQHGTPQYEEMIRLRMKILRVPLGLTFTAEELAMEKADYLIACYENERMVGCCVLTVKSRDTIQLRQMAVDTDMQGKSFGAAILSFAEDISKNDGYRVLMMHAREVAAGFYEKLGYTIIGDRFTEVTIPHYHMEKSLV
jgi:N-acetylglutamate synthase-like GNAT family acetyltransferase